MTYYNLPQWFDSYWLKDAHTPKRDTGFPAVNIQELENAYVLEVVAPGLSKEDFSVSLEENILSIGFEREQENEGKWVKREFVPASFNRRFELPKKGVDADSLQATYEQGILRIQLPKKEAKKLEIAVA